ncbi:squalene synthase HpnC [Undibacterium fentianense]|uniref:Squalene synthase HpnC n=1 Tax=Undibacterium fentianense TaxID=2828728 RepID=A0A941IF28_9BURK|nr:squalene synthase HpnC [Undibacterium fentianense]MBR7800281.1 squalene synthase HpnC [Undibacterium fentianense]
MSVDHYENFPVASWLIPSHLRPAIRVIYAFARSADDIADEGAAEPSERLVALANYEEELHKIQSKKGTTIPLFKDLEQIISKHQLSFQPFLDLISAFKQDVIQVRYRDFDELLDYCARSANPVGQIMLQLYQADNSKNRENSNRICTALQLINFWQDIAIDWDKSRIYLPQDDMRHFGIDDAFIAKGILNEQWQRLMQFEISRARAMILEGSPLCHQLPGRIGFELRLVIQGGLRILEKIEARGMDVFRHRPIIQKLDGPIMFWRAIRMSS